MERLVSFIEQLTKDRERMKRAIDDDAVAMLHLQDAIGVRQKEIKEIDKLLEQLETLKDSHD